MKKAAASSLYMSRALIKSKDMLLFDTQRAGDLQQHNSAKQAAHFIRLTHYAIVSGNSGAL
jgi:hypothetical protein